MSHSLSTGCEKFANSRVMWFRNKTAPPYTEIISKSGGTSEMHGYR